MLGVHTSCGWLVTEVSSLVASEKTGRFDGRGRTLRELLVELGYSGHANGIFGGTEALDNMSDKGSRCCAVSGFV